MPQHATPALAFQKGIITWNTLQVAATVTFANTLDVPYDIYFQFPSGIAVNISSITQSNTGFTINLGVAIGSQTVRWYAVQQQ